MPHTQSRYMQNLEFPDARMFAGPGDLNFFSSAGSAPLTRNAAGDWSFNIAVSTTGFFAVNVSSMLLRRTGFFEDLQEQFGPANQAVPVVGAIAGEAQIQLYRPDQTQTMAKGQQITPRPAFKVKGYRLLGFDVIYIVTGAPFATLSSRVDMTVMGNNLANAITNIVPLAANGLTNLVQVNPYVSNFILSLAQEQAISNPVGGYPGYVILPDESLWVEVDVVTGGGATGRFYGIDLLLGYNYN